MTSHKKRTPFIPTRRFTTREIMKITEERRLKKEAEFEVNEEPIVIKPELPIEAMTGSSPQMIAEVKEFISQVDLQFRPEKAQEPITELSLVIPIIYCAGIISLPYPWVNQAAEFLNGLILKGSFYVLSIPHVVSRIQNSTLILHNYKISLLGDWVSVYSLGISSVISLLLAIVITTTYIKRIFILVSFVPLALAANIFRIVFISGTFFNYGPQVADHYFKDITHFLVMITIVVGLTWFALLFRTENN